MSALAGLSGLGLGSITVPGIPGLGVAGALSGLSLFGNTQGAQDSNVLMLMNLPKDVTEQQVCLFENSLCFSTIMSAGSRPVDSFRSNQSFQLD
jgi:hypothetical protein